MEGTQQVLNGREKVRRCAGVKPSVDFLQEITTLREEMEVNRKTLCDREEVRQYCCGDHSGVDYFKGTSCGGLSFQKSSENCVILLLQRN